MQPRAARQVTVYAACRFAVNTAAEEVDKVIMIKELAGWDAAHITSQVGTASFTCTRQSLSYM